MKIVVIDGPRGSGKSSTALMLRTSLSTTYDKKVIHVKREKPLDPLAEGESMWREFLYWQDSKEADVVILERFAASEYVMNTYFRRSDYKRRLADVRSVSAALNRNGHLQYLLMADEEVLTNRIKERQENRTWEGDAAELLLLWRSTVVVVEGQRTISTEQMSTEKVVAMIIKDLGFTNGR